LDTLFTAEHIGKSFHLRPVLKDVSFSLAAGETVLLFGRNGSGKTTLLRILAGIMRPEKGTARLNGSLLFTADSRWRRDMVYLGHQPNLYPAFTARENLMLSVRLRGQAWDEETFRALLTCYGLAGREHEPVLVYSEGMLQRLGLRRRERAAWRLARLDEPSAALAPNLAATIFERIVAINASGVAILIVEQNAKESLKVSDRGYVLASGRNRFEDTGENLLANQDGGQLYLGG